MNEFLIGPYGARDILEAPKNFGGPEKFGGPTKKVLKWRRHCLNCLIGSYGPAWNQLQNDLAWGRGRGQEGNDILADFPKKLIRFGKSAENWKTGLS